MSFRLTKINVLKVFLRHFGLTKLKRPFSADNANLDAILRKNRIVPDLMWRAPEHVAHIRYSKEVVVTLGCGLSAEQTKNPPICMKWPADKKCYYFVYMCDLDAPCQRDPIDREWRHWMLANVPGSEISCGAPIVAYIGPWPQNNSGLHRYVFTVYKQKDSIEFEEPRLSADSLDGRAKFDFQVFRLKYCLGEPIAANFFVASYSEYVKEFLKKFECKK